MEIAMAPRIFISHESSDLAVVEKVVQLLVEATGARKDEIRCNGVPGCTMPIGSDLPANIAREIREAAVFVCLFTRDVAQSAHVLLEAGARWGADRNIHPLLSPEIAPDSLPGPIAHRRVVQLARRTDLLDFVREVAQELGSSLNAGEAYDRTLSDIVQASDVPVAARAVYGFCIRCRLEIPRDDSRPYCQEDYEVWAQFQNLHHQDSFCHRCGKDFHVTKAKPLCDSCQRVIS